MGRYWSRLVEAACVTIALSLGSMPLAMLLGLVIAIGRIYGPYRCARTDRLCGADSRHAADAPALRPLLSAQAASWVAGIGGLAINYSAYEAEIYRAGLQAIPQGQMEAALALGMSRWMALRRVIIPQAVRIVIPRSPTTSSLSSRTPRFARSSPLLS